MEKSFVISTLSWGGGTNFGEEVEGPRELDSCGMLGLFKGQNSLTFLGNMANNADFVKTPLKKHCWLEFKAPNFIENKLSIS